ncbi:Tetratricopeptide repeat (TPR)-like superfamily protein [Hibiscus syriacus]|uniref:Tetratricopeptide repeat (TPR)-like superfamily protein n=1 Tax=Hibiscus syriacus TaxID=106335 RepID=A0A6A2YSX0_HIBSY|nr:Tetratricopeptide repeat (TPR)-like superfamily protein [Hibiscus syriacus]
MKRLRSYYMQFRHNNNQAMERKWIFPLAIGSIVSLFLLFLTTLTSFDASPFLLFYHSSAVTGCSSPFIENQLNPIPTSTLPSPPRFAFLISGSAGDGRMLRRTLLALYYPLNQYVVHLDREASSEERLDVEKFVKDNQVFNKVGNVRMIVKANLVTYRGPTMVANTLHAAAVLLKEGGDWDWFINLSATDYPLVTQDGLRFWVPFRFVAHIFIIAKDLNFIDHTSNIGWKEFQRAKPIIVDPGLYGTRKADAFWVTQRRSVPTAFKLFTVKMLKASNSIVLCLANM